VDKIFKLKEKSASNPWPVIEEIINVWASKKPGKWRALLLDVGDLKDTRATDYGSSKTKSTRYLVDVPEEIVTWIRVVYNPDELPMNKKFWRTFANKFPSLRVAKKL
jgi:hypothetical protein